MGWRNTEKNALELLNKLSDAKTIIIFDVETSGISDKAKIIQFSAIRYQISSEFALKKLDFFDTYINPEEKLQKKITEITGITNEILDKCQNEEIIGPSIENYLKSADIYAAHNAPFDTEKVNKMFERIGIEFRLDDKKVVDTLTAARDCFTELDSFKLSNLIDSLNLDDGFSFHNSLDDVKATARLLSEEIKTYQKILERIYQEPTKRVAAFNWASCWINPHAKSQQRIKVNLDDDLYGYIFWDITKKQWGHLKKKAATQLFNEIDLAKLEEQVIARYGKKYQATSMDKLGSNWLKDKKKKEKESA